MNDFINYITNKENIIALQGLFIGIGGALMWLSAKLILLIKYPLQWVRKLCTVTIELNDSGWGNEHGYRTLMMWVEKQKKFMSTSVRPNTGVTARNIQDGKGCLHSGSGRFYFFYKRRLFITSTYMEIKDIQIYYYTRIIMFGRNKKLIEEIIIDAFELNKTNISILVADKDNGEWYMSNTMTPRKLETLAIPDGVRDKLSINYTRFLNSEKTYIDKGIVWKNNLCLYGKPGTGKTSIIRAYATSLNLDIYYIDLKVISDDVFVKAVSRIPINGLLVLEDIDGNKNFHNRGETNDETYFNQKDGMKNEKLLGVSIQSLLNVLDGIHTPHGLKSIMTTNYLEKLDSAIIRKGRVDLLLEIPYLDNVAIEKYLNNVFNITVSVKNAIDLKYTGSQLSTHVLENIECVDTVIEKLMADGLEITVI